MKFTDQPFVPLLLGADINVYSMARAFHEAYGVKTIAYGLYPSGPCYGSSIIDYRVSENNATPEKVLEHARHVSAEFPDKTVLLLGCGDDYLTAISSNLGKYPDNVVAPYVPLEKLLTLIHKARFYELCERYGIDYPKTVVYTKDMGHDFVLPFDGPFAVKPAESATYWDHPFDTQRKGYIAKTRAEVEQILDDVYAHGYEDAMIIQDFIPGGDENMRVLTCYSDGEGKVRLMCLGHVLLEEHTRHGVGNHAVVITEPNEELYATFRRFLEEIHFVGFSNFDIKYDPRDGKYKVFEINCRQGRSNYYVTGAGYNLAKFLVEDRVEHKSQELVTAQNRHLWMAIPKKVAYDYIPRRFHGEMKALEQAGAYVNPLWYGADKALLHKLRIYRIQRRQFGWYANSMEKPKD